MTDCRFAEEVKDFVLDLFEQDISPGMEEWKILTPIELGILSWHLSNFYCECPFLAVDPCSDTTSFGRVLL